MRVTTSSSFLVLGFLLAVTAGDVTSRSLSGEVTGVEATKLQTGIEDTPPQTWQQSLRPVKG